VKVQVIAPLIGEGVEELNLVAWKKKVGEAIAEGEELVELESDKVTTELPSPAGGRILELLAAEGETVAVGAVIAIIEGVAAGEAAAPSPAATATQSAAEIRPHSILRRRIAERMIASQMTSAHVLTVAEADMSAVAAHRAANKDAFAKEGIKLTFSAYFAYALGRALRRFPEMNSSWSEEGMILHPDVNLGIAVSLGDGGLIVPVLKKADALDLKETAQGIERLASAAREGALGNDDVKGGTFTLTNYGTTGSLIAAPIINQPQIGILGAGSLQKRPVVIAGPDGADAVAIRAMVYLSLVFDHRAMDGEAASRFLGMIKEALEAWGA
jgi:pyruvate/2-oxoglutarate dehydrogenase complex dihydrolipoamide acyltransferase (E2) component